MLFCANAQPTAARLGIALPSEEALLRLGYENHYRLVGFGDVLSLEFRVRRELPRATSSNEPAPGLQSLPDSTTSSDTRIPPPVLARPPTMLAPAVPRECNLVDNMLLVLI